MWICYITAVVARNNYQAFEPPKFQKLKKVVYFLMSLALCTVEASIVKRFFEIET